MIRATRFALTTVALTSIVFASTCLAQATGFAGGEPASYDVTIFVDGSRAAREKDGSQARPFDTMKEGIDAARASLREGKSTRLLIKPGVYREGGLSIGTGMDTKDNSKNADLVMQDAWLRIDRWDTTGDDTGEVILRGSDDWSVGTPQGTWTKVQGHADLYSRPWIHNWGLWGGSKGSANVSGTAGQRREMIFVDLGDGQGPQRLTQVVLEKFKHSRPRDTGNAGSWWGPGNWEYVGFAGLDTLTPGTFGVIELSPDPSDDPKLINHDHDYQPATVITAGQGKKMFGRKTFKQIFDAATDKAPPELTNRIYLRLPAGRRIEDVKIEVSTRERALQIDGKRNFVVANLVFERYNARLFDAAAFQVGRQAHDWFLTTGNALLDNLAFRDNNNDGARAGGTMDITWRHCTFDRNGSSGLMPAYTYNTRFENCTFTRTGWRAHGLGSSYTFIPAALKFWNSVKVELVGCKFVDNLYKGFYSDAGFEQAVFRDCVFSGNIVGSMHEVSRGPKSYIGCTFEDNKQGLALIQCAGVKIDDCTFSNNLAAIVPEAKGRTAYDMADTYAWGGSMLINTEQPLDLDNFEMHNSRLSSTLPGARLIVQGSRYSNPDHYVKKVRQEAKYSNNRYFLSDHPYAFEDARYFSDFQTWTKSTGESDAAWDPSLAKARPVEVVDYPVGFTWKRSEDAQRRAGGESDIGRTIYDAKGRPQWYSRMVHGIPGKAGLSARQPWYTRPLDHVSFGVVYRAHQHDYAYPRFERERVGLLAWGEPDYNYGLPIVEWRNPSGQPMTINIAGTLGVSWDKNQPQAVDVVIAAARADGTFERLREASVKRPTDHTQSVVPIDIKSVRIGASDRILIGHYVTEGGGYGATTFLRDDLTFTVVNR